MLAKGQYFGTDDQPESEGMFISFLPKILPQHYPNVADCALVYPWLVGGGGGGVKGGLSKEKAFSPCHHHMQDSQRHP